MSLSREGVDVEENCYIKNKPNDRQSGSCNLSNCAQRFRRKSNVESTTGRRAYQRTSPAFSPETKQPDGKGEATKGKCTQQEAGHKVKEIFHGSSGKQDGADESKINCTFLGECLDFSTGSGLNFILSDPVSICVTVTSISCHGT
jgi:hypothetical protein